MLKFYGERSLLRILEAEMKKKVKKLLIFILINTFFILILSGCKPNAQKPFARSNFLLGTTVDIMLYDSKDSKAIDEAFDRIREIENKMTINTEGSSEIIQLNESSGINDVTVSPDTFFVLEKGLYYSQLTQGKFDITVGPIVKLWNIGTEKAAVPQPGELKKAVKLVDYKKLHLNKNENKVSLDTLGMKVDLGAIAKGYAADEVGEILKNHGIKNAIINLGGNILTIGGNPRGEPFKIGVQNPFNHRGDYMGILSVRDKTIVTSGIYEKNFESEGVLYHHILDTETGYPMDNNLAGVSIITDKSIDGDGLSTSAFLLGLEKSMELINSTPGAEAIFITKDKKVYPTEGAREIFALTNEEFQLIK